MLRDLKERGLLDDTIVIVTGEFGRTSYCEGPLSFGTYGRDHNQLACSLLVAGGGFKRGFEYGATDDYGWSAVDKAVHVHDLQATVLHCLGLEHTKLVHRYQGRDFRLTDVAGNVVKDLLA
jgi:arylsulfatase A-like enzyme